MCLKPSPNELVGEAGEGTGATGGAVGAGADGPLGDVGSDGSACVIAAATPPKAATGSEVAGVAAKVGKS
jgi:hypothetical protein